MTIRHLRIFLSVYHTQNMTESARQLFMTQPSVSQAIHELEDYYGVVLFERLHRQLYPTYAADTLNTYATKIIALFDEMEREIDIESTMNQLRIGANYTVGISMLSEYLHKLKKREPEANVTMTINKGSVLKDMLRKNELDLILTEEQNKERDLIGKRFANDHTAVVVKLTHRLAKKEKVFAKDLLEEKLLIREKGVGTREQFEAAMNKKGYEVLPFLESISVTAILKAVIEFDGVAVLPYEAVKESIEEGKLIELTIEDMQLTRFLALFHHKDKYLTNVMEEFINIVCSTNELL